MKYEKICADCLEKRKEPTVEPLSMGATPLLFPGVCKTCKMQKIVAAIRLQPEPKDFMQRWPLCMHMAYCNARQLYAEALAYDLKLPLDATYGSQSLGYVDNRVAVITSTRLGLYAQYAPGDILPVNRDQVEYIRTL